MLEALESSKLKVKVNVVRDGDEVLNFMYQRPPFEKEDLPDLILLDLNIPRRDGREVLKELKQDPNLSTIPIVVLTSSKAEEDIAKSYNLHANAYISKPVDLDKFMLIVQSIDSFWFSVVTLAPKTKSKKK